MEDFLQIYEEKCKQNETTPCELIYATVNEANRTGQALKDFKLNGNDPALFENRWDDKQVTAFAETIVSSKSSSSIKLIDLSYHNFTDAGAIALAEILSEPNLSIVSLNLQGNNIKVDGVEAITSALRDNDATSLEYLNLNGNPFGNDGGMAIADMLSINRKLKVLEIGSTDLGTESIIAISTVLYDNSCLQELNLERPLVYGVGQETSIHIGKMLACNTGLAKVNLGKFKMRDVGAKQLARYLRTNETLKELILRGNLIGPEGAEALGELLIGGSSNLTHIDLAANMLKDDGAATIASVLRHNSKLLSINLQSNSIEDKGLCAIAEGLGANPSLKEVFLWGNSFGPHSSPMFSSLFEGRFKYYTIRTDFSSYVVDGNTKMCLANV